MGGPTSVEEPEGKRLSPSFYLCPHSLPSDSSSRRDCTFKLFPYQQAKEKSHPAALRHLSHGQHEPDGSHSLAPKPGDNAREKSKSQPVPDRNRGTEQEIARVGPITRRAARAARV